jgi:hypothetical protein
LHTAFHCNTATNYWAGGHAEAVFAVCFQLDHQLSDFIVGFASDARRIERVALVIWPTYSTWPKMNWLRPKTL